MRLVRAINAGVVHQDVQPAELADHGGHGHCPVSFVGDIQWHKDRLATSLDYLRDDPLRLVLQYVRDGDSCALLGEYRGLRGPHAARGTRNHRHLAFQPHESSFNRARHVPGVAASIGDTAERRLATRNARA